MKEINMKIGDKVKHKDQDIYGVIIAESGDVRVIEEIDNPDELTILSYKTKELIKI